jgi:hypothetical protein
MVDEASRFPRVKRALLLGLPLVACSHAGPASSSELVIRLEADGLDAAQLEAGPVDWLEKDVAAGGKLVALRSRSDDGRATIVAVPAAGVTLADAANDLGPRLEAAWKHFPQVLDRAPELVVRELPETVDVFVFAGSGSAQPVDALAGLAGVRRVDMCGAACVALWPDGTARAVIAVREHGADRAALAALAASAGYVPAAAHGELYASRVRGDAKQLVAEAAAAPGVAWAYVEVEPGASRARLVVADVPGRPVELEQHVPDQAAARAAIAKLRATGVTAGYDDATRLHDHGVPYVAVWAGVPRDRDDDQ